ncbi:MAG: outer membrane lipoprotein carrier protein LolA [Rhodospirillaceae bacterium]|nr:outer membrane lipoprotein carrier protein LolA [Rhodospirillaceae bacterium]
MKIRRPVSTAPAGFGRRRLLAGAAALAAAPLLGLVPAFGAETPAPTGTQLSARDQQDIDRVEAYLNGIKTMKARFQQFSQQGGLTRGWIFLRRPGQVRVQYDPPTPVVLVSDGTMVNYYDSELDQLNQVPLSSSPLWFLLRPNVRLNRDVTVNRIERAPGALKITLTQTDEPDTGAVSLVFRDPPLELMHWYIRDQQGQEIQVALYDTQFDVPLENALFQTPRTRRQREGSRNK